MVAEVTDDRLTILLSQGREPSFVHKPIHLGQDLLPFCHRPAPGIWHSVASYRGPLMAASATLSEDTPIGNVQSWNAGQYSGPQWLPIPRTRVQHSVRGE